MRGIFLLFEEASEGPGLAWRKTLEGVARCWKAGINKGKVYGAGARKDIEGNAGVDNLADETVSGVADSRVSAVGTEDDLASGLKLLENLLPGRVLTSLPV